MRENHVRPGVQRYGYLVKAVLYGLAAIYLLNCVSHLRLHTDMLRYFAIKDCVELGCPPDSVAAKDYLPWGYTGLLLLLSKISNIAFEEVIQGGLAGMILLLSGLDVMIVALALILFPFLWKD